MVQSILIVPYIDESLTKQLNVSTVRHLKGVGARWACFIGNICNRGVQILWSHIRQPIAVVADRLVSKQNYVYSVTCSVTLSDWLKWCLFFYYFFIETNIYTLWHVQFWSRYIMPTTVVAKMSDDILECKVMIFFFKLAFGVFTFQESVAKVHVAHILCGSLSIKQFNWFH